MMPSPRIDDRNDTCHSLLARRRPHKSSRQFARLARNRTANLVAQRPVRPLIPIRATMFRDKAIGSTASANPSRARRRG
jgi:hypothetical protein